ncbi:MULTISPECIES: urea ABC transporter permease subunit UrtC [Paraburkholderia]|jgi:urea transport system permease protein|uniref:Urea ABC transporter permease UrtC n=1 Tax=Paraburkholderia hospita TaxID=169430 RepID=A0AAJ5B818_9BURK|nr:urea ABC transporter permease subunit UrtC [Paraburkholderia hospita]SKC80992.1 amino acid/amide ABC transporter membrane protein 2, HAAT family [Burkholderia sp. CF099]SOE65184.1 amino acid/amide ABC transporter membrane protein 2, HAAT family [Burkholderia sp. YR290]AUT69071.1 urea ABC transporter permease subunit UrtC [Paraburkholderia hospita]AXE99188.1 urea ABC transporter permease subunit UrtC [Paraburkholderia hospita]EIN00102.1 urea ABC transporter permease UrtC [Paraburkholderia ho
MTSATSSASTSVDARSDAQASERERLEGFALGLPPRPALLSRRAWQCLIALIIAIGLGVPFTALVLPETSAFHLSAYAMTLTGKLMCYAISALALDLVWGYCGILSLGHGLFFALGGYAIGMYLMRAIGHDGKYGSDLPDFMVFLDWHQLPWYWEGTQHLGYALLLVVLVPAVIAWVFGFFTFRSRVKGVYLSIITQAMTFAAMLLFYRNETGFGGNNGFTDFKRIAGYPITHAGTRTALFLLTFAVLVLAFIGARAIVTSKLGRVVTAVRDGETRLMFLGYSPLAYKLFVWTVSAVLCGIAGALYVPQVGIINPGEMSPGNSIEMAIWVAVGGRGTLIGPIIGAFAVNGAKSFFTAYFAEYWLFFLGLIFVLVPLLLPNGIMGLFELVTRKRNR